MRKSLERGFPEHSDMYWVQLKCLGLFCVNKVVTCKQLTPLGQLGFGWDQQFLCLSLIAYCHCACMYEIYVCLLFLPSSQAGHAHQPVQRRHEGGNHIPQKVSCLVLIQYVVWCCTRDINYAMGGECAWEIRWQCMWWLAICHLKSSWRGGFTWSSLWWFQSPLVWTLERTWSSRSPGYL